MSVGTRIKKAGTTLTKSAVTLQEKYMSKEDLTFIMSILSLFAMDTPNATSKNKAIAILNKLQKEVNHV